jgi:hypothetical protein
METNNLADVGYHHVAIERTLDLSDPELVRIIRIRYLGDSWHGPFDLSYAHGELADGTRVRVAGLPDPVFGKGERAIVAALFRAATEAGRGLNRLCGGKVRDVLSVLA